MCDIDDEIAKCCICYLNGLYIGEMDGYWLYFVVLCVTGFFVALFLCEAIWQKLWRHLTIC